MRGLIQLHVTLMRRGCPVTDIVVCAWHSWPVECALHVRQQHVACTRDGVRRSRGQTLVMRWLVQSPANPRAAVVLLRATSHTNTIMSCCGLSRVG